MLCRFVLQELRNLRGHSFMLAKPSAHTNLHQNVLMIRVVLNVQNLPSINSQTLATLDPSDPHFKYFGTICSFLRSMQSISVNYIFLTFSEKPISNSFY